MSIEIEKTEDAIAVTSPYDGEFIARAKEIGGRWNGDAWVFDVRDEERVRDLCMSVYGEDGRATGSEDLVSIRFDAGRAGNYVIEGAEMRLAGRRIAHRPKRDWNVKTTKNVVVVEGSFENSGGSRKNPRIGDVEGVILEIRDLSPSAVEKIRNELEDRADAIAVLGDVDVEKEAAKEALISAVERAKEAGLSADEISALIS